MSHSIGREDGARQVWEARQRIIDRIKVLEDLKTDADVFARIGVAPEIARSAFRRGDIEVAWEHKFFGVLADHGEGRGLVDDLRRAKNRFVEAVSGGPPYRTLRRMKGHEILSLSRGEARLDDQGNAKRPVRLIDRLFDDGIAEATPLTWRNAATFHIDTIVVAVRTTRGDMEAFRNASALLLDMLSEPFNAHDDFLHFLRVVYRGAGDLAAQFAHQGALASIVRILVEKQNEAAGHPGSILCDRMINEYRSLMTKHPARERRDFALKAHSKIEEGIADRALWVDHPDMQHGWASTSFNVIQSEHDDAAPRTLPDCLKAHDDILAKIAAVAGTNVAGFHSVLETLKIDEPHAAQFIGHELLESAAAQKSGADAEKALTILDHAISKIDKNGPGRTIVAQLLADRAKALLLHSGGEQSSDFQTYEWEMRSAVHAFDNLDMPVKTRRVLAGLGSLERRMRIAGGPAQRLHDQRAA